MVDARELRIGNWVAINGVITKVATIANDGVNQSLDTLGHCPYMEYEKWEWIEPIEITEEWLLRFGFRKMDFKNCLELVIGIDHKDHNFKIELFNDENYIIYSCGATCGHAPVQFVHQFQNLYFALTGKELEIKEQPIK